MNKTIGDMFLVALMAGLVGMFVGTAIRDNYWKIAAIKGQIQVEITSIVLTPNNVTTNYSVKVNNE